MTTHSFTQKPNQRHTARRCPADRTLLEQHEPGEAERERHLEIRVVGAERPEHELERRQGDEQPAQERSEAAVAPAHEDRVREHAEGRRDERRRDEERGLRDAEEPERQVVEDPAAEPHVELILAERAVRQDVQQGRVLLRIVAEHEALAQPPPDGEGDGEEGGGRQHVDAHWSRAPVAFRRAAVKRSPRARASCRPARLHALVPACPRPCSYCTGTRTPASWQTLWERVTAAPRRQDDWAPRIWAWDGASARLGRGGSGRARGAWPRLRARRTHRDDDLGRVAAVLLVAPPTSTSPASLPDPASRHAVRRLRFRVVVAARPSYAGRHVRRSRSVGRPAGGRRRGRHVNAGQPATGARAPLARALRVTTRDADAPTTPGRALFGEDARADHHVPHCRRLGVGRARREATVRLPYRDELVGDPVRGVVFGGVMRALDHASGSRLLRLSS